MRTWSFMLMALATVGLPVSGHAATCAVTDARVIVPSVGLDGPIGVPGLGLTTTVNETAGTFALKLTDFPDSHFVIQGVDNEISFPAPVAGTIDSGGTVTIPGVPVNLLTHYTEPPTAVPILVTLSSGIVATLITGADFATAGAPLDFTTGTLVLEGQAPILAAPGTPGPITAGVHLACTLAPIPTLANLPQGPTLDASVGKGSLGNPHAKKPKGDSLTLNAKFTAGAKAIDPSQADVFARVRDAAGTDVLLARVKAGDLVHKGKKFLVVDTDGTKLRLVKGRAVSGSTGVPVRGRLMVAPVGKAFKLTLMVHGVDLAQATAGAGSVTVAIGDQNATQAVTVRKAGKKVSIR